jgi:asparagine synthase (glutamine-hydrolysing)
MCGIAGFLGGDWSDERAVRALLDRMAATIRHRGPDRSDIWLDRESQVGFAHTRLSIIDLSNAGNQPMDSHSGRHVIIYNGEIYNHQAIREEIARTGTAPNWNGHSDTETLLAAIELWGVRGALERAAGMFAFALWDRSERTLVLARDRLGEKPLYYGRSPGGEAFLFASELKAVAEHPQFQAEVDRDALTLLLRYGYVPAPFSIYRGIAKLAPGTFLSLSGARADPMVETYWSAAEVAERGAADPLRVEDAEAVDQLEALLDSAVGGQMLADVPLGAFLSGGVDSSTVVAVMQKLSSRPVKTFTIGFHEKGYDEAIHAKAVARHLGTDHTELYVTAEEARHVIPQLPQIYDEPFADSSQIPTHLVARLAREHVTVALSGDGGDEIFGGYNRYLLTSQLWNKIAAVPRPLRAAAAQAMTAMPRSAWNRFGELAGGVLPKWANVDRLGDKVHKGAPLLGSADPSELYLGMVSLWRDAAQAVQGGSETLSLMDSAARQLSLGPVERMMALDLVGYLPDDILVKVDRAAMAVSLETRVPYLDHRVVEFAWRLPMASKLRSGQGKWLLRQLLYRHVPKELIERPKMGFAIPLGDWLRGPLRDWAEDLLDERRLAEEGYFRAAPIRRLWTAHLAGRTDESARLWPVLMFQSWLETQPGLGGRRSGAGSPDDRLTLVNPACRETVPGHEQQAQK